MAQAGADLGKRKGRTIFTNSHSYQILENDPEFLLVDKPPGIAVQGTLGSLVAVLHTDLSIPIFPVHRLDSGTSGLVIFAKTVAANQQLSQLFQQREVDKYYIALSHKKPSKKQGIVLGDMVKARGGSYKLLRSKDNPAKTAFFSFGLGNGYRLFVCKLYSGKTHQIRVALKSLGAPIVGDDRYGGLGSDRMYLHALELGLPYSGQHRYWRQLPSTGELFVLPELQQKLQQLGPLHELNWPV